MDFQKAHKISFFFFIDPVFQSSTFSLVYISHSLEILSLLISEEMILIYTIYIHVKIILFISDFLHLLFLIIIKYLMSKNSIKYFRIFNKQS